MFDVLAWTQRGFVLAAQPSAAALAPHTFTEYMKRVYDFGVLSNRADFNGDGLVNALDQTEFNAVYAIYQGRGGCNWVHGDLNGDNYVGAVDSFLFRGCPETGIHHRGTEITENKPLILRLLDLCVSVVRID
jgi:hypothetical protein